MSVVAAALHPLPAGRLAVGYSGGLDSTALLHALAASTEARTQGLRAVHVHHGLHADADAWAKHCEHVCAELDVPLQVLRVQVEHASGRGPEGAARAARLHAFRMALNQDEVLALAHHRDDQAETVLLRLLRGAGGDGLGAMRRRSRLGPLHLWRPLLGLPRVVLLEHATAHALRWIEDPSNADTRYDRNFLRHRVLPVIAERWPHATRNLARSAALLAEQSQLLASATATQLDLMLVARNALSLSGLLARPRPQRARLLRSWFARLELPVPPASILAAIECDLLPARADGDACVEWTDAVVHRWRDALFAERRPNALPTDWSTRWDGRSPLRLPDGAMLELCCLASQDTHGFEAPMTVRTRQGGERIRLPGRDHSHVLKHVLQESDVPPWIRARMPLLFADDGELLAAGDAILSARMDEWLRAHHAHLRWLPGVGDAAD